jgi:hypothetical protein
MAERLLLGLGIHQANEVRLTRSASEEMTMKHEAKTGKVCAETDSVWQPAGLAASKSPCAPLLAGQEIYKDSNPAVQRSKDHP